MSPTIAKVGTILPPPTAFGLPDKFGEWRVGQESMILHIIDDPDRFLVLVSPVGSGKSLSYVTGAILQGGRALILTSTKALQTQLKTDFGSRIADVRGRNAYKCAMDPNGVDSCEDGPCVSGWACPMKNTGGCSYYRAVREARESTIVSTNYSYWMFANSPIANGEAANPLGRFDLLICDEAHDLPDAVTGFLTVRLDLCAPFVAPHAPPEYRRLCMTPDEWAVWGNDMHSRICHQIETSKQYLRDGHGSHRARRELVALTRLQRQFWLLQGVKRDENWVCYPDDSLDVLCYGPVWAHPFVEKVLFAGVKKVVMTSASVNEKTVQLIGVRGAGVHEFEHTFPLANRRVTYIPTVRMNYQTDESQLRLWVVRIDQIIRGRLDRKGIIHTVSYKRRDFLLQHSEYAKLMVTHNSKDTEQVVREFKGMEPPKILVSPSVTTGFDFPGVMCEYQIIGKLPYPDTTDRVTRARIKVDPDYAAYVAMQELVQASGRGVRAAWDKCETMIIDDNMTWFWKRYRRFAPKWFRQAYQIAQTIPTPPERLWGRKEDEGVQEEWQVEQAETGSGWDLREYAGDERGQ